MVGAVDHSRFAGAHASGSVFARFDRQLFYSDSGSSYDLGFGQSDCYSYGDDHPIDLVFLSLPSLFADERYKGHCSQVCTPEIALIFARHADEMLPAFTAAHGHHQSSANQ